MGQDSEEYAYYKGIFDEIKGGDIIFIKSFIIKGGVLRIRAIGFAKTPPKPGPKYNHDYGIDIKKWIKANPDGIIDIKVPEDGGRRSRTGTIFREYNQKVIDRNIELIQ